MDIWGKILIGMATGAGIVLMMYIGHGLVALSYGKKGMAARKTLGKDNKAISCIFGFLALLSLMACVFAFALDDPEGLPVFVIFAVAYVVWVIVTRMRVPKLIEQTAQVEEKRKLQMAEAAEREKLEQEKTKQDQAARMEAVARPKMTGAVAGVGSLRDILTFALKYSSQEGLRKYLEGIVGRSEDEEIRAALQELLAVPDDRVRQAVQQKLENLS